MSERLDRIERTLKLIPAYRIEFREQYKLLLSAQVQMQGGIEDLRKGLDDLRTTVGALATNVYSPPPTWNPCDRASTNA